MDFASSVLGIFRGRFGECPSFVREITGLYSFCPVLIRTSMAAAQNMPCGTIWIILDVSEMMIDPLVTEDHLVDFGQNRTTNAINANGIHRFRYASRKG